MKIMGKDHPLPIWGFGPRVFLFYLLCIVMVGSACAPTHYQAGLFTKKQGGKQISYQVGMLPSSWKRMKNLEGDLVFRHQSQDATILANALCGQEEDRAIDFIVDDLFSELGDAPKKEPQEIDRKQIDLQNGQKAWDFHFRIPWGHRDLLSEIIIVKQKDCIYDLQLLCTPSQCQSLQTDFQTFYKGFVIGTKKEK